MGVHSHMYIRIYTTQSTTEKNRGQQFEGSIGVLRIRKMKKRTGKLFSTAWVLGTKLGVVRLDSRFLPAATSFYIQERLYLIVFIGSYLVQSFSPGSPTGILHFSSF